MTSTLKVIALPIPALTRFSAKGSQYDFGSLTVGGPALVETSVVDADKAHSRVSSALTAYRKRSGDKSKFTVRVTQLEGKDVIGVWKLENAPVAPVAPVADNTADNAEGVQGEFANV